MGRRCGCVGKECNCAIRAGRGVSFSGNGDQSVPLEITQSAPTFLRAGSTDQTDVTVEGTGSLTDPYQLSMEFVGVPESKPLNIETYETPGSYTWNRPEGCTLIEVTAIGGGGGGTGGKVAPGGLGQTWAVGGLGGQGGGWSRRLVYLPPGVTSCLVVVGTGGSGGVVDSAGGFGNDSYLFFDGVRRVCAKGGGPGTGTPTSGGGVHRGYAGPTTDSPLDVNRNLNSPAGGGGGKGADGNQTIINPGGDHLAYDGTSPAATYGFGGAGNGGNGGRAFIDGGGGSYGAASSGAGQTGHSPGGGGGGGRGGVNGQMMGGGTWYFNPGLGGNGAPGYVEVIAY